MKKILIVDDSAFMRRILKDLLLKLSTPVEIFEAGSIDESLQQLNKIMPNLVLLDMVMNESEMAGAEILKHIRQTHPAMKVIIISSVGQTAIIEECKKLGVEEYILKPFDENDILKKVNKYLV